MMVDAAGPRSWVLRWVTGGVALLFGLAVSCTATVEDSGPQGTGGQQMNCPAGQRGCAGACIDVLANPTNCGACGKACSADQICDQGACKAKAQGCSAGLLACGGGCIDPLTSANHCGGCDHPCGADKVCSAGACACQAPKTLCGA